MVLLTLCAATGADYRRPGSPGFGVEDHSHLPHANEGQRLGIVVHGQCHALAIHRAHAKIIAYGVENGIGTLGGSLCQRYENVAVGRAFPS
jgi:hypothetical protein